jgi:p-hydroxybenzoate 3-monooxygenase
MADVQVLAEAIVHRLRTGSDDLLDAYSGECLRRIWRAEHFSWWMTSMLHRPARDDPFDLRLRLSQLRYVTTSEAAARSLAENYVGLESV